jgi:hypothetical protein
MMHPAKNLQPEIIAWASGLAALVFFAKGMLAMFWQDLPAIGWFWIVTGATMGIGCGWGCLQMRKNKALKKANRAPEDLGCQTRNQ